LLRPEALLRICDSPSGIHDDRIGRNDQMTKADAGATESLAIKQSRILEMIATGAPLREILDSLILNIESAATGTIGSVVLLDDDGVHLRHCSAPRLPAAYAHTIDGVPIGPVAGSCGTAMYLRRQVIVSDIMSDPLWANCREKAAPFGLRACWSTPIFASDGRVLGSFAMYYRQPQSPTPFEEELIAIAVHLATIAIERHRVEKEAARSRRLLEGIIDTATAIIYVKDLEGRYVLVNQRHEELLHVPKTSIIGKTDHELFPKEAADLFRANDRQTLAAGRAQEFEETVLHGDRLRTYISVKSPLRNKKGEAFAVCGISTDITERRAAEEQQRQRQKMEAIGQLTGGVAHDFNNVLTVITGTIDILADAVSDRPQLATIVKMIDDAAERGAELTRHLLAFARKQPLMPRPTDINSLIAGMIKILRPTVGQRIEIESMLKADAWLALVDPTELSTALINLAVNARDAMPNGGKLTLEAANVMLDEAHANIDVRPGPYVMITVRDTGGGIAAAIRDKVFDPFFTTKEMGKGTGLGLSMVYGFVKQSGGDIRFHTEEGRGTTFELFLPRAGEHAEPAEPAPPLVELSGAGQSVLVVEDDALVREAVIKQLESLGYKPLVAANSAEALALVDANEHVDLLFTDLIMPGPMSGRQLAEEVVKRRPSIKVLYTSGYTENNVINHGRLDADIVLLNKPYHKSDLARKIRMVLSGAEALPAD
jgi:PAS domain S-box-containing protein